MRYVLKLDHFKNEVLRFICLHSWWLWKSTSHTSFTNTYQKFYLSKMFVNPTKYHLCTAVILSFCVLIFHLKIFQSKKIFITPFSLTLTADIPCGNFEIFHCSNFTTMKNLTISSRNIRRDFSWKSAQFRPQIIHPKDPTLPFKDSWESVSIYSGLLQ